MKTREVSENTWKEFCAAVEEHCRGSLVSLEHLLPDGSKSTIIHNEPLRSFRLDDTSDPCNTILAIGAGPLVHNIVEPIHIRLRSENGDETFTHFEIKAENENVVGALHPGYRPVS